MIRTLKLILAGDGGVGKTSLVRAYMGDTFKKDYLITVGVDVSSKQVTIDKVNVVLSVNDIAGQPRFESFRTVFFKGANLALLVFDLTRVQTLNSLETSWIPQIAEMSDPNAMIHTILIGNKSDLEDFRSVSEEDAIERRKLFQKKFPNIKIIAYLETSALDKTNVNEAFTDLTKSFLGELGL